MKNNKLQPVEIHDLFTYQFPGNLQYSPDGKFLAFEVAKAREKENDYTRNVWISNNGEVKQLSYNIDASIVSWLDDKNILIQRNTKKEIGVTELFALPVDGGEAMPLMTLPFALSSLKVVDKNTFVATGTIDAIGFEMTEDNGMVCIGPYDITIDELLSGNEGRGKKKLDIAENFIKEYFGTNKVIPSNEIMMEAAKRSIKRNTLLSAKKKLGITSDLKKATVKFLSKEGDVEYLYYTNSDGNYYKISLTALEAGEETEALRVNTLSLNTSWYTPEVVNVNGKYFFVCVYSDSAYKSYVYAIDMSEIEKGVKAVKEEKGDDFAESDYYSYNKKKTEDAVKLGKKLGVLAEADVEKDSTTSK